MQSLLAAAARLGTRQNGVSQSTFRAAAALQCQCRGVASAQQAFSEDPYDVVMVGGGMVGIAFAALLGIWR